MLATPKFKLIIMSQQYLIIIKLSSAKIAIFFNLHFNIVFWKAAINNNSPESKRAQILDCLLFLYKYYCEDHNILQRF